MLFYVGEQALKDLNVDNHTPILDENGDRIGAELYILPVDRCLIIQNLFGCGDAIYLDEIELEDDHFNCTFTSGDTPQCVALYIIKPVGYKTKWVRDM